MARSLIFYGFLLLLSISTHCFSQASEDHTLDLIVQARSLAERGRKNEAADLLKNNYREISPMEDSVRALNLALQYFSELKSEKSVYELSKQSIEAVSSNNREYFNRYSLAFAYITGAAWEYSQDKQPELKYEYLEICSNGMHYDFALRCKNQLEEEGQNLRARIEKNRKKAARREAFMAALEKTETQIKTNSVFYWSLFVITMSAVGIFAMFLLRAKKV